MHRFIGHFVIMLTDVEPRAPAARVRFSAQIFSEQFFSGKISRDSMTAALLSWWTVPRLNVIIQTHPIPA